MTAVVHEKINVKGDEVAQMATQYNPTEIAYFKLVVSCSLPLFFESRITDSLFCAFMRILCLGRTNNAGTKRIVLRTIYGSTSRSGKSTYKVAY